MKNHIPSGLEWPKGWHVSSCGRHLFLLSAIVADPPLCVTLDERHRTFCLGRSEPPKGVVKPSQADTSPGWRLDLWRDAADCLNTAIMRQQTARSIRAAHAQP